MDLTTEYLGLKLRSPLVPSASPLSETIDGIRRMEDAGASAVVLHSLFEEQLRLEEQALHHHLTSHAESYAESLSYFPEPVDFHTGPSAYLEHVRRAKEAVAIPIIASLNGATFGAWTDYARQIEQAGADALELNIYSIPTDLSRTSQQIEEEYLEIVRHVRGSVSIPLAVKLSPFFTSFAHMARRFVEAGADALVVFNRFYQPDIDLEQLDVYPHVVLSGPAATRLPLRWIAILYGRLDVDFAATSGIHGAHDVLKMLMVGANVTMLCSALLKRGIGHLATIERELVEWLTEHEYESVRQLQGSMSQLHCPDPAAYERSQYMRALHSYRGE